MPTKRIGQRTVALSQPPSVLSFAAVGGKFEAAGPLGDRFDETCPDSFFGERTWEKAESAMQKRALQHALDKARLKPKDLDYILAGDLLNQCIGSSFSLREFGIPFYGLYGACSTMGESLSLASMLIDGGFARRCAAMTSSHFCTAERQYRMPVHRPVDRHRLRLHHPLRRGGRPLRHPRHLRKDRGPGHPGRQQHGRRHGP